MKRIAALACFAFAAHTTIAQNLKPAPAMAGAPAATAGPAAAPARTAPAKVRKTGIAGIVTNRFGEPASKVQAYVYNGDNIMASGYADANGRYETNNVLPGTYTLRLVYPKSGRRINIPGVPVKMRQLTVVNYRGMEPVGDSTIAYTDLMPQAPKAK